MDRNRLQRAKQQAKRLAATIDDWCQSIDCTAVESGVQTEVLMAKCAGYALLARIAEIERKMLMPDGEGRPAA